MSDYPWDEFTLPTSPCQALSDEAIRLEDDLNRRKRERADLLGKLVPPWVPGLPKPPELQRLDDAIAAAEAALADARRRLHECLGDLGPVCGALRDLLEELKARLLFHQKEITRKIDADDPRPKDVIMRDIRAMQAAIRLVRQIMGLLGC
jgi:hypothetical protein